MKFYSPSGTASLFPSIRAVELPSGRSVGALLSCYVFMLETVIVLLALDTTDSFLRLAARKPDNRAVRENQKRVRPVADADESLQPRISVHVC